MNEKLNLLEILKDCPKGTKLYSTVFGEVKFKRIDTILSHPIVVRIGRVEDDHTETFSADGRLYSYHNGECVLFPSKEERDWSKFNPKKTKQPKQTKFDPKTLQAFDRVLTRDTDTGYWDCDFFAFIKKDGAIFPYSCVNSAYVYCIPYNDDTKHLVGTTEEAPEYYRYWED